MKIGASERPDLPVAVVVGAGGMGMSTARRLGQTCRVILTDLTITPNDERQAALNRDGVDALAVRCDITDPASVAELTAIVAETGRLRTLAHVAALSPASGDWRSILRVNLIGAVLVERAMLRLAGQGTAAIFVSSIAGHMNPAPSPEVLATLDDPLAPDFFARLEDLVQDQSASLAYGLSKAALNRMCRRRAGAWGRQGGRIVSMSPGMIATPMGAVEFAGPNRERKLGLLERTPIAREGTMVETADAIEFLASDRASFITGTDLLVDGGVTAAMLFPE